jgi:DUF438 domain-containing protein
MIFVHCTNTHSNFFVCLFVCLFVFIVLKCSERSDRRLAQHLVSLFFKETPAVQHDTLSMGELTDYINYARTHINPTITDEAAADLVQNYVNMRQLGVSYWFLLPRYFFLQFVNIAGAGADV